MRGASAMAVLPQLPQMNYSKNPYREAIYGDDNAKQAFLDEAIKGKNPTIKKPHFVSSVDYATAQILDELRTEFNFMPSENTLGITLLDSKEATKLGRRAITRIIIFKAWFRSPHDIQLFDGDPQLYEDLEIIVKNNLSNGLFAQAKLYHYGMPDYQIESFKKVDGKVNANLYKSLIELFSISSEYIGLINHQKFGERRALRDYAILLKKAGYAMHRSLFSKQYGMDPKLMEKLKDDFDPSKFFLPYRIKKS